MQPIEPRSSHYNSARFRQQTLPLPTTFAPVASRLDLQDLFGARTSLIEVRPSSVLHFMSNKDKRIDSNSYTVRHHDSVQVGLEERRQRRVNVFVSLQPF